MNKFITNYKHSFRMLKSDWRSGELRVLFVSLVIAITCVTAVGFFIDRVSQGMNNQASELIAADLVITAPQNFNNSYYQQAQQYNLNIARTLQFRSVILVQDQPQLVEVKAVSKNYPLRGTLRISDTAYGNDADTDQIPDVGEVWVESRLLSLLKLKMGDTITLGKLTLTLKKILRYEPDRGGNLFSLAPRVMINYGDVAASSLVQQGSLAHYNLLLSNDINNSNLEKYRSWIKPLLHQSEQLITTNEGRPALRTALDRAQEFLGLAALISVLLAGVAVATTSRRFVNRHTDASAIMRSMGASQASIIQMFTLEMLWLASIASAIGCIIGWFTQLIISQILDKLLLTDLPGASYEPIILGFATGVIMLLGFVLPPLLSLKNISPLRVLRKDQKMKVTPIWLLYVAVLVSMGLLLQWQLGQAILVLYVMVGMIFTLLLLSVAALLLIKLLNRLRLHVGVAWRFGFANIARRPTSSVVQIVAFGLGIMVLLLLSTVSTDLLNNWQRNLPADAANHFLINVQTDQVADIKKSLSAIGISKPLLYPMVRARISAINSKKVSTNNYDSPRAKHLITREFNISWSETLTKGNTIVAGNWWTKEDFGTSQMSLAINIAKALNIKLNDTVSFEINGSQHDFEITSLKKVKWDTFKINFMTVVPPKVLEDTPTSWVSSFHFNKEQKRHIGSLIKKYPNITILDVDIIMTRIRAIIDKVTLAVEFIFIFSLFAGIAVLIAAIQAYQDERRFENAILRTLGAQKKTLLRGLIAEFITMGALSGFLAGIAATSIAYVLSEKIFQFDYQFDPTVALIGIVSGVVIVGIAGVMGTYSVLTQPPLLTLREN